MKVRTRNNKYSRGCQRAWFIGLLLGWAQVFLASGQPGSLDPTFIPRTPAYGSVVALALQPDGKLVFDSEVPIYSGVTQIGRLLDNGASDTTFTNSFFTNTAVLALALDPQGRILLGGEFLAVQDLSRQRIARLDANGLLDPAFNPAGPNAEIAVIIVQTNGQILVGGPFKTFNGIARNGLARLNPDGSLDPGFNPGAGVSTANSDVIKAIVLLPGGRIVVAGNFTQYNGVARSRVAVLNPDGSLDTSFDPGSGPDGVVNAIAVQPDGKLLLAGGFTNVGGVLLRHIARLNPNGSLDTTFAPVPGISTSDIVYPPLVGALGLQADGSILVGGSFDYVNGLKRQGVARLFPDGSLDRNWDALALGTILSLVQAPGGAWYVAGAYFSVQNNPPCGLARLKSAAANVPGRFEFNSAQYRVDEAAGTLVATVQRTGGSLGAATVMCSTEDGTARFPGDYLEVFTNLSFAAGQTQQTVSIPIVDNGRADDVGCCSYFIDVINGGFLDRNVFGLRLDRPGGGAILGSQNYSVGIINEKDTAFALVSSNYAVAELDGFVDVQVKRIGNKDGTNAVTLTTMNGTALAGQDYAPRSEALVFVPGDATKSYRIQILENPVSDGNRSFQVVLSAPSSGTGLTNPQAALITIQNQPGLEASAWPGAVDTSFLPGNGVPGGVYALALQLDLKIIVGGGFNMVDGVSRYELARLNPDADFDASYLPAAQTNLFEVKATTLLPDGRLLVGGRAHWDLGSKGLILLDAGGNIDPSFNAGSGPELGYLVNEVDVIVRQPDGKLLVGGDFQQFNGAQVRLLTRLNADGSIDATFHGDLGVEGTDWPTVRAVVVQPDGRILVGGSFGSAHGLTRRGLARLLTDGSVDPSFNPEWITGGQVFSLGLQQDGRVIVAGSFYVSGGGEPIGVARLLSDGSRDGSFDVVTGGDSGVSCFAIQIQPDDKILIGGSFTTVHGVPRSRIARLNPDGGLDVAFDPGTGANDTVSSILRQPDGAILIGGAFNRVNDRFRPGIARLLGGDPPLTAPFFRRQPASRIAKEGENVSFETAVRGFPVPTLQWTFNGQPISGATTERLDLLNVRTNHSGTYAVVAANSQGTNTSANAILDVPPASTQSGSLDLSFYPGTGARVPMINYEANVTALAVDSLGRSVIGGNFSRINGLLCGGIARLLPDGGVDPGFLLGSGVNGGSISSIALQPDGKALIAGWFFQVNGATCPTIARLNADGTVDSTFNSVNGASYSVYSTAVQPDGRIVVAGDFSSFNGTPRAGIARLNPDGTLEDSFDPGTGSPAVRGFAVALQPDGKILLGGFFSDIRGVPRNNVARFNPDGTLDDTFAPSAGISGTVFAIGVQPDGRIVAAGSFDLSGGTALHGIIRLLPDGNLDPSFDPGIGPDTYVRTLVLQNQGRMILAGPFTSFNNVPRRGIVRLLPDGSVDPEFNTGTGPDLEVYAFGLQADGRLIVGGGFTNFDERPRAAIARLLNSSDSAAGALEFTQPAYTVWENGGTNLVLKVRRSGGTQGPVQVNYAVAGGTGVSGVDYQPFGGILAFTNGETGDISIPLAVINNQVAAGDRFLNVWLGTPWGGATWGTNPAAQVQIIEDDTALEFARTRVYCTESQGVQPIEVRRLGRLDRTVSVTCFSTNGTAQAGVDYVQTQGTLVFAPGETNHVFLVPIIEDRVSESDLTVNLALTNVSGGAWLTTNSTAVLTILDNDRPGSLDTAFDTRLCSPYSRPVAIDIAVQRDGRPVVVLQEQAAYRSAEALVRFLPNGVIDPGFASPFSSQLNCPLSITELLVLPDDRILLAGLWTDSFSQVASNFVLRLSRDGQVDPSFASPEFLWPTADQVTSLIPLPNGQVVIGGSFQGINQSAQSRLARLNANGTLDTAFDASAWASNSLVALRGLALCPDGKMVIGGFFSSPTNNGDYGFRLARVNPNGSLDPTFNPGATLTSEDGYASDMDFKTLLVQPDGRIVVGGIFGKAAGLARTNLARFNADGSLDTTFAPASAPTIVNNWNYLNCVTELALQPDNKLIVGGTFARVNDLPRNGLVRLNADGSVDPTFFSGQEIPNAGTSLEVSALALQPDGGILVGCDQYALFDLAPHCGLVRVNGTRTPAPRWISVVSHPPGGKTMLGFFAPPGTAHWIQACTNWSDWKTLGPAADRGGGFFEFEDTEPAQVPRRFYRLLSGD